MHVFRRRSQGFLVASFLLTALFPLASQAGEAVDGPTLNVVGGGPVKDCAWPAVAYLNTTTKLNQPGMCTGTLIHPRVILYAAHCGTLNHFRLGKDPIEPAKIYEKETIEKSGTHPDYKHVQNVEVDWAYALLKEPVKDVPIVPVSYGCELEQLIKSDQPVHFVGFSPNTPKGQARPKAEPGNYAKRSAQTTITKVSAGRLEMRQAGKHVCEGDSGGPLMARLPKGGWRTVGVASIMTGGKCKESTVYSSHSRVRREMVEWIEKETGVDVTPCYDLEGKPEPSAACDRFMAFNDNPAAPKGKWDSMCSEAPQAKVAEACGVPESGENPGEDPDKTKSEDPDKTKSEDPDTKKSEKPSEGTGSENDPSTEDTGGSEKPKSEQPSTDNSPEQESKPKSKKDDSDQSGEPKNSDSKGQDEVTPPASGCDLAGPSSGFSLGAMALLGLLGRRRRQQPQ